MIKEFKEFAARGNVMDMAVGIIIGVAFGAIVTSFVGDILMPPIGALIGNVNFTDLKITIAEGATINYGNFIQTLIDFLIIALVIFLIVKLVNKLFKKKEERNQNAEETV